MILLDTNVLIYAFADQSPFLEWSRRTIAAGVSGEGAAVNAVSLAEIYVGDAEPDSVADRLRSWGITLLDIPAAAAEPCAKAYSEYRQRRRAESGREAPALPLPDFLHRRSCPGHGLAPGDGRRGPFPDLLPGRRPADAVRPLLHRLGRLVPGLDLPQPVEQRVPTRTELVYRIEISPSASRQLKKLDRTIQGRIFSRLDRLAEEPRPRDASKLEGHEASYRVRVGDYRIIYDLFDDVLVVFVIRVGHRREVYRDF